MTAVLPIESLLFDVVLWRRARRTGNGTGDGDRERCRGGLFAGAAAGATRRDGLPGATASAGPRSAAARSLIALCALLATSDAFADVHAFDLKVSLGGSWQARNDVEIPNDGAGTRFSLDDVAGSGPWPLVRLEGIWTIGGRHGLRLLLAPLSYRETGSLDRQTRFAGASFDAERPVRAEYRFNSWRLGYRYRLRARDAWDIWVGGTLKVRDAEIRLEQNGSDSADDDVGFVPLLYLAGEYRLADRWTLGADLDGLAGGPGRAIDLGVSVDYQLDERWRIGVDYRALEGGADTDDVYNFAWFNSLLLSASYRR